MLFLSHIPKPLCNYYLAHSYFHRLVKRTHERAKNNTESLSTHCYSIFCQYVCYFGGTHRQILLICTSDYPSICINNSQFRFHFFFEGNGLIDFSEFCTLMQNFSSDNMENEIREAFKLFDSDGSGKISTDEIRQVETIAV